MATKKESPSAVVRAAVPKAGTPYHYIRVSFQNPRFVVNDAVWHGWTSDKMRLVQRNVFLSRNDAIDVCNQKNAELALL